MRTLLSLGTAFLLACCGSPQNVTSGSTPLRNVDVTVVYPLPSPAELPTLLAATDPGAGGPLLDTTRFGAAGVPDLDGSMASLTDAERLATLRVVSIRFDPCPGETMPPSPGVVCHPDIRLVFQSLYEHDGQIIAHDGAIHAFYAPSASDFAAVLEELRTQRAANLGAAAVPLGVHPALASEGPNGPFATRMRALVTKYAGPEALVRVTQFRQEITMAGSRWQFSLRQRSSGAWSDAKIATTEVTQQRLTTIVGGRWDADVEPAISHGDDVTHIFKVAIEAQPSAFNSTARVLNPKVHSSESIDCASCHIAPDVASFGRSTLGLSLTTTADHFSSKYSLESAAQNDTDAIAFDNIHMSSYLGAKLSVTSRVANETAAILEHLNGD